MSLPYLTVRSLKSAVLRMSEDEALAFGARMGILAYHTVKSRRRIAERNVSRAMPWISRYHPSVTIHSIVRGSFINLGKNLIEFLRIPLLTSRNIHDKIRVEGMERLSRSLDKGKGVILFIPHMGNWELLAPFYGATLHRKAVVVFPMKDPQLNELVDSHRTIFGVEIIPKRGAAKHVLRKLRENYVIGLLADQNAGREGVFVEFFGELASCARGPVTFALKTGAALHLSADIRQPDDTHILLISEPIEIEISGDMEEDVQVNTRRLMAMLEDLICRYPDQWLWIHNRWKTRPDLAWLEKRKLRAHRQT
jgi:KDO2-lipid IV(A) lauroyltransferase